MLDPCGPSDDVWRKFALPVTPPCSPQRCNETTTNHDEASTSSCEDVCDYVYRERLQDMSESLDSSFDADDYRNFWRLSESFDQLRSKLISDCMWGGEGLRRLGQSPGTSFCDDNNNNNTDKNNNTNNSDSTANFNRKLSLDIKETTNLFPTPCPSPPQSDCGDSSSDCGLDTNDCVDPASVFPFSVDSGSNDDEDEDEDDTFAYSSESSGKFEFVLLLTFWTLLDS